MLKRHSLWLVILLVLISLWINLPSVNQLPEKISLADKELSLGFLKAEKFEINLFGKKLDLSFLTPIKALGLYPVKLGLDLQGGTELILKANMDKIALSDQDTALESAKEVIEKRVNYYGVSEAVVRTSRSANERRILVELPGVKDMNTAVNLVGQTAQLEFREIPASLDASQGGLASPSAQATASAIMAIFEATPSGLTGADIKRATTNFGPVDGGGSEPVVEIEFTAEGAGKFATITKRNIGRQLPIFLDGSPIMAPTVKTEIIDGKAIISGGFDTESAKSLAIQLNAGALPVPIEVLSQRQINPTLGNQFLDRSIMAGIIGLVSVMIFMVVFYGRYGILANLALIFYALFVLAIFRTGLFILPKITLTLAGIAGFVLSVGMAVDANILTFERIKEEKRAGRTGRQALEHGFSRAWTSIRDSNVSSLITASILYLFGTSMVKGFALTLGIGVLVSMFSAITVTRILLRRLSEFK